MRTALITALPSLLRTSVNGHTPARAGGPPLVEPIPIGGPTSSSWREHTLTRVAELEDLTELFRHQSGGPWTALAPRIHRHLKAAREAAEGGPRQRPWTRVLASLGGSPLERSASNLDAAEADVLRLAPDTDLRGQLPSLLAHVRAHLAAYDPRLQRLEALAARAERSALDEMSRASVVTAVRAASSAARREALRVRSFRNVLYVAATFLTVAAIALAVIGLTRPDLVPLCFNPDDAVVCPTSDQRVGTDADVDGVMRVLAAPWDVLTVEVLGLIAAAVASAAALRNIRGTTTPYSLPVALALLKLPTGALTAVLGLLLMRGEFVPGLTALDTPAQILAWAVIFGYAQQVFTRFVDQRAHAVLDGVSTVPARKPAVQATPVGAPRVSRSGRSSRRAFGGAR